MTVLHNISLCWWLLVEKKGICKWEKRKQTNKKIDLVSRYPNEGKKNVLSRDGV